MHTDIASSSLRELNAVALATNVTVFMKLGTELTLSMGEARKLWARREKGAPDYFREAGQHSNALLTSTFQD